MTALTFVAMCNGTHPGSANAAIRMPISAFHEMLADETAQGLVEYAFVITLVALAAIAALRLVEGRTENILNNAALAIPGLGGGP